jgi:opacity protein-like surface antigen
MSSHRFRFLHVASVCCLAAAGASLVSRDANASILDLGAEVGVLKRSLSDTDYGSKFAFQLNADLAFFPLLKLGPYVTFTSATAQAGTDNETSIAFRTIGARLKLTLPLSDVVQPFGVAGIGWAHADFPDQTVAACRLGVCAKQVVPSASANFAEFLLGAGLIVQLAGPLALTGEFDWRPTTGYKNDVYDQQIQAESTTAPDPSRNGVAWVGLFGLALTL